MPEDDRELELNRELESVVTYMKGHWPSAVKPEWQVEVAEYPEIVKKAVDELTVGASRGKQLIRGSLLFGA